MSAENTFLVADFSSGEFPTIRGFPHPTQMGIMPVVAYRDDLFRPLGTCFSISNVGLVLTARHVVDAAFGLDQWSSSEMARAESSGWGIGALYVRKAVSEDNASGDLFATILSASQVYSNVNLDIAALRLQIPTNTITGRPLRVPAVRLSPGLPKTDRDCLAFGYHSMEWGKDGEHTTISILQSYSASRGRIEEVHPTGRDRNCPFPCFRTSSRFDAGMSGAPVINEGGDVIGIVCSSFGNIEGQGHISYASLIGPALILGIDVDVGTGRIEKHPLYELAKFGIVSCDETLKTVAVTMQGETSTFSYEEKRN